MPRSAADKQGADRGKARLLAEARKLFWTKGYNDTSVRDIARAYGCQPANIYNFFANKEAILFEVLMEEMEQIVEPIRHLEQDEYSDALKQLRHLISTHLKVTLSYRRTARTLFDVALDKLSAENRAAVVALRDDYDRILRTVIRRGVGQGVFAPIDERLAGFMIANMITRSRIWFQPGKGVTAPELCDFIYDFVLRGLKAPGMALE